MIFQNILFHNVSELSKNADGSYTICRLPAALEPHLNTTAQRTNRYTTGVELRFVMLGDEVRLRLRHPEQGKWGRAIIYFGSIASGWQTSEFVYTDESTEIVIPRPDFDRLSALSDACGYPFSPQVVRIILTRGSLEYLGVSGDIRPPEPSELPSEYCLFYGSSITNGSLALSPTNAFVFRIAESLGLDYRNLGFSGSAHCEIEVADYLATQQGMKFICLAAGANIGGDEFDCQKYAERVKPFVARVAQSHPDIPVFVTDQIYCVSDFLGGDWAAEHRTAMQEIVRSLALKNIIYINGTQLLNTPRGLSGDLVHPNSFGVNEVYRNYLEIIRRHI